MQNNPGVPQNSLIEVMRRKDYNPSVPYSQVQPLIKWTYAWMAIGLLVTTVIAALTVNTPALLQMLTPVTVLIVFFAQIGLVVVLSAAMQRLSPSAAAAIFVAYSALTGFTLSVIFLIYTATAITTALLTTVALFGTLTLFAFTTKLDLSRWQNILIVGVIGIVIASLINFFLGSALISYLISIVGVIIFSGLTAVDTQKLKRLAAEPTLQTDGTLIAKMSIFMALELYLDFINLFLFILRLMGGGGSRD